jgi:hypothetical protein
MGPDSGSALRLSGLSFLVLPHGTGSEDAQRDHGPRFGLRVGPCRQPAKALLHRFEHRKAYFASDALICVSRSTRDDLLRVYPHWPGAARSSSCPTGDAAFQWRSRATCGGDGCTIRLVRRRAPGLQELRQCASGLRGVSSEGAGPSPVCTGASLTAPEMQRISHLGPGQSVRSVGTVTRDELARLYAGPLPALPLVIRGFGPPLLGRCNMAAR